jgi:2-methylcitrate dehydratase
MSTVSETLAEFAARITYDNLPDDVKHVTKRQILDSLGCGLGAVGHSHLAGLLKSFVEDLGGRPESTLLGTKSKTSCLNATLYNTMLVRNLGMNDTFDKQDITHASINIPALLAVGEKTNATPKEFMTAVALGYEVASRFCEVSNPSLNEQGWFPNCFYSFSIALGAAKLLGLKPEGIASAFAIAGSRNHTLFEIITSPTVTSLASMGDPLTAYNAVLAALLAQKGITGPNTIIEGKRGYCEVLKGDAKRLTEGLGKEFVMKNTAIKPYVGSHWILTSVTAALDLRKKHKIAATDIERVEVRTFSRVVTFTATPDKFEVTTPETAHHSLPYCVAIGLLEGNVGPAQFTEAKLKQPELRRLLKNIQVLADPELEKVSTKNRGPAIVTIELKNGSKYTQRADYEKGNINNPMSDEELEEKFLALTNGLMAESQARKVAKLIFNLEDAKSLADLTNELLVQPHQ